MKFSEQWLREWVDPPIDTQTLADQLTMAGLEVDAVTPVAPQFTGVVVGRVLDVAPHPGAERLRVCRVDDGSGEPLTIVCGAANVATGMCVPTARVGATLTDGSTISRGKLRGIESHGMLCSARELGLSDDAEGLMMLPPDAQPGVDLRVYLGLDDVTIDLGLTPNRGDCLGIAGIAREISVLNRTPLSVPSCVPVPPIIEQSFPIALEVPAACPRYLGRVIRGIDPNSQTPLWMRERLRRSGLRSLGPVVDVTNYLLLEQGQPMHVFDLDRLNGGIRVRHAHQGESITLLDGQTLDLSSDMLVIADHDRATALAGIMGGEDTAVGPQTANLFLECAFFAPAAVMGRARRLGLHTDSSHRFERGVDPALPARAIERATRLILEIAGGEPGPVTEAVAPEHLPLRSPIRLRMQRIARLLGYEVERGEIIDILERLGMRIEQVDECGWMIVPPPFRFDIAIEADLIEEIARVHGYDRLPARRPRAQLEIRPGDALGERVNNARRLLAARGYQEAISYSFIDADRQRLFDPDHAPIRVANPISAETAVMRTSLWPGLAEACLHNLNRQQQRVRLFENGSKYIRYDSEIKEENVISGLATGEISPEQWGQAARKVDFYDLKGDVESLLEILGGDQGYRFAQGAHPALHPGQSARVTDAHDVTVAWVGSLHPQLAARLGFDQGVLVFEIALDRIASPGVPVFSEPSKFPMVRRDLAVIVDESVPAADLLECVRVSAGEILQSLSLFDIYRGKGVDSGKKSIALGLTLQNFSRTLTEGEVEVLIQGVLGCLQDKFGATLRE